MERSSFSSIHTEEEIIAIVTVEIDLTKNVFAVHGVDETGNATRTCAPCSCWAHVPC
jgi:hypothetical protein